MVSAGDLVARSEAPRWARPAPREGGGGGAVTGGD